MLSLLRACFTPSAVRKSSAITALLAAVLLALPRLALAGAWLLAPGEHYSVIGGSYFSSDSYYDLNGTRGALRRGGLHEEQSVFAYNEFGWTKGRSFILGLPFTSVTRRLGAPDDSSRTETGFGDLLVGVRWKLQGGPQALSFEADWRPPLGYNRNISPRLGDGAASVLGKLAYGATLGHSGFFELEG
ncbi:MAG: transporter, partial [Candidatus Eiseniibacteriota bacterium]